MMKITMQTNIFIFPAFVLTLSYYGEPVFTKGLFSVQMISIFMCFRILTVVNQLGHEQNLLIVPNTACLTSLILQQYKNGFKDELR